jgi:choline kinase
MKALILAAGRGSRMKTLTEECPKCLVELHGKPLLSWQLEALHTAGISDIGIVTGYRRDMLAGWGLTEFHNPRWAETNMVSSLACAEEWLKNEACIVSYSDIFYDKTAITPLIDAAKPLAITYDINWETLWRNRFGDPLLDAETFRLNPDGTVKEIGNKPQSLAEIEGQYMGLLRFTPESWAELARIRNGLSSKERDQMHMTGALQKILEAGRLPVSPIPYSGNWGEIDSPEDLAVYAS